MSRSFVVVVIVCFALVGSLFGVPGAFAQNGSGETAGITTTGFGLASGTAVAANLQFLITRGDFYGGPPQAPQVEATPGAESRSLMEPIAEAVEGLDGVESVEVIVSPVQTQYYGRFGDAVARLDVRLTEPDLAGLTNLLYDVTGAAAEQRLFVGYVGASYEAADCDTLEREARQAAIADARGRAEIQAELLEVELGDVTGSADIDAYSGIQFGPYGTIPGSSGGCNPIAPTGLGGESAPAVTFPPFDPTSQSDEVEVYRQVQITFAIAGGA